MLTFGDLKHLCLLVDFFPPDLPYQLYHLILYGGEEQYLAGLRELEFVRLVYYLDEVCTISPAFH